MEIIELVSTYHIAFTVGAWLVSFIIGFVIVNIWKKGMDTARGRTHACDYTVSGSLDFHEKKDRYLYS
ncbi:MAG: hypothetical protein FWD47_15190, partial [Treponema sp.]|nr:hypothetical protein [Treponema sp.]